MARQIFRPNIQNIRCVDPHSFFFLNIHAAFDRGDVVAMPLYIVTYAVEYVIGERYSPLLTP